MLSLRASKGILNYKMYVQKKTQQSSYTCLSETMLAWQLIYAHDNLVGSEGKWYKRGRDLKIKEAEMPIKIATLSLNSAIVWN